VHVRKWQCAPKARITDEEERHAVGGERLSDREAGDRLAPRAPAQAHVLEHALDLAGKVVAGVGQTLVAKILAKPGLQIGREDLALKQVEDPKLLPERQSSRP
jgi:hypothetical protein